MEAIVMIKKTYTARINRVRNMQDGLQAHLKQLARLGATPEFLAKLTRLQGSVYQIQEQRKTLKNIAMEATAAKNRNLKEAEKLCSKARKWVRRQFPQETWSEFGFRKGEYGKKELTGEK
jgi:hypothetical protein